MTRCNICNYSNNIFTSYLFGRSSRLLPPFLVLLVIFPAAKYLCGCLFYTVDLFLVCWIFSCREPRLVTKSQEAAFITLG